MIDIKNKYQKYQVFLWLGAIAVAMAVIKTTYKPGPAEQESQPSIETETVIIPTPTEVPEPIVPEEEINYDEDFPLWQLLPYSGAGFTVDRYLSPKTLGVKIKGIDKEIVKERVNKWLLQNQIEPETHKIEYLN